MNGYHTFFLMNILSSWLDFYNIIRGFFGVVEAQCVFDKGC